MWRRLLRSWLQLLASPSHSPYSVRRVRVRPCHLRPSVLRFLRPRELSSTSIRVERSSRCRRTDRSWRLSPVAEARPRPQGETASGFVAMADLEARPLPGTDGATSVFWSPDGLSLAFFAERKLKRIDLPDGAVVTICDVGTRLSATAPGEPGASSCWDVATERRSTLSRQRAALPSRFCPAINRRAKRACTGRGSSQMGSASCTRRASTMARGKCDSPNSDSMTAKGTRDPFSVRRARGRS